MVSVKSGVDITRGAKQFAGESGISIDSTTPVGTGRCARMREPSRHHLFRCG